VSRFLDRDVHAAWPPINSAEGQTCLAGGRNMHARNVARSDMGTLKNNACLHRVTRHLKGSPSECAVAISVTRFKVPGPDVEMATPTRPVVRPMHATINAACSSRTFVARADAPVTRPNTRSR
jgi:hypothetical protein